MSDQNTPFGSEPMKESDRPEWFRKLLRDLPPWQPSVTGAVQADLARLRAALDAATRRAEEAERERAEGEPGGKKP